MCSVLRQPVNINKIVGTHIFNGDKRQPYDSQIGLNDKLQIED